MIRPLALVGAGLFIAACADVNLGEAQRAEAIVDGDVATGLSAVVAIAPQRIGCGESPAVLCSGTLIAPDAVLSAAHCFSSRRPGLAYEVVVGDSIGPDAEVVPVTEVATHPGFDADTRANDVAILWLAAPVTGATPEPLPASSSPGPVIGAPVELAGFGATAAGTAPDGVKRIGVGRVGQASPGVVLVDPDPSVSCVGDSGGPLFTDSAQLIGVASSGDTGCTETSVYALIAPTLATFIEPTLRMGPMERPPALDPCGQVCAANQECPVGFVCLPATDGVTFRCALPGQEAGALTNECTGDSACTSGFCASNALIDECRCYEPCDGLAPEQSGGCSVQPGPAGASPAWWIALALLVVRTRRRISLNCAVGLTNVCGWLLLAIALIACKSIDHTETADGSSAPPADAATTSAPGAAPHDEDAFVNSVVGFSVRKPPSWRFGPTAWGAANLDQLEFKDDEFAEIVLENATEPLVVVVKYSDTADALSPVFRATFRPLGELRNLSPEQVADMLIPQFRDSFADFNLVREVERTQVSGHPAAHFASSFTVDDLAGATHPIVTDTWMVKRGDYLFILGASAPSEDPCHEEFHAIMQSISIDAGPF